VKLLRRFGILLLLASAAAAYLVYEARREYAGFAKETFVDFPKGTSTREMAQMLRQAGVIRHAWVFVLLRALDRDETLRAGEYRFHRPASALEVYDRIQRGDVFYYELRVPEGRNMFDIGDSVHRLGLFSAEAFLRAARDPTLIRDLDAKAPSLEGYLFPDTYRLSRHTTPERLCQVMTSKFREVWRGLRATADVHETVTLASLVERESKLPEERPMVASVFGRRLARGMKLDCDPTAIYAALLESRYHGAIHKADLESPNPYNTYRHAGLPPGPIANPGVASLQAVLHPAETRFLYFVLRPDGSGAHTFSEKIADHEVATAKYRRANHH
jgi:UPF0755 protein